MTFRLRTRQIRRSCDVMWQPMWDANLLDEVMRDLSWTHVSIMFVFEVEDLLVCSINDQQCHGPESVFYRVLFLQSATAAYCGVVTVLRSVCFTCWFAHTFCLLNVHVCFIQIHMEHTRTKVSILG